MFFASALFAYSIENILSYWMSFVWSCLQWIYIFKCFVFYNWFTISSHKHTHIQRFLSWFVLLKFSISIYNKQVDGSSSKFKATITASMSDLTSIFLTVFILMSGTNSMMNGNACKQVFDVSALIGPMCELSTEWNTRPELITNRSYILIFKWSTGFLHWRQCSRMRAL